MSEMDRYMTECGIKMVFGCLVCIWPRRWAAKNTHRNQPRGAPGGGGVGNGPVTLRRSSRLDTQHGQWGCAEATKQTNFSIGQ